ncbi:hypothetical protein ANANG_G00181980 [Anguilla anguilla]|uniref:SH2 domain-containing protein n=1 Tax=Anguilla anguilla TaxID=7936 RepID=A0A9D3M5F0_ANGAN|nr:hypothetical protein ANANG_G00181980 [Anguilla anguilla]
MDFDYQMIKDSEMREREARLASLPVPQSQQPPARQIPPVKPRRSIKSRPAPKEEAGPPSKPANGRESETVVQKMPAAVLRCGGPGPLEALSPSLRAHTLLWFERSQMPHLRRPGQPLPCWLHGFATRREAEELLKDEPEGCFLVRLSESKIGFVLSYRGRDRCRHFILEQEEGGATGGGRRYLIAGETSRHGSLQELIDYYTQHAVGPFDEVLTMPCAKGKRAREDLSGQDVGGTGGGALGAEQEPESTPPPPPPPPPPRPRRPSHGDGARGSGEEQKYWELVPMHTYEETHHLTHPEESHDRIDFYAMGRRQDIQRSGEGVQNHLYSEVNLRGLRDGPPTVAIPLPPEPRAAPQTASPTDGLPLSAGPRPAESGWPPPPDSSLSVWPLPIRPQQPQPHLRAYPRGGAFSATTAAPKTTGTDRRPESQSCYRLSLC